MRISREHFGHRSGSASHTFLINSRHFLRPPALRRQKPVFDFRAHFCHSAPMETHAFGFRLRANAPEGQKRFPISRSKAATSAFGGSEEVFHA